MSIYGYNMKKQFRQILRSIIVENVVTSRASAERAIHNAAKSSHGEVFKSGTKSRHGEIRLQPKDPKFKLTYDQIMNLLSSAGHPVQSVANPGDTNSKSGKFKTYITSTGHSVVFAGGGNAGQTRENTLVAELQGIIQGQPPSEHLLALFQKLGFDPSEMSSAVLASAKRVKRPIGIQPTDVGEVISDVTIQKKDGSIVYISLKLDTGSGLSLSNVGYSGSFTVDVRAGTVQTNPHSYDSLLAAVGLSKKKIAQGLQSLIRGNLMNDVLEQNPSFDKDALRGYLSSAYGYGYWYVKESKHGWEVIDLTTLEKLNELVGDPKVEMVVYPGISIRGSGANSRSRSVVTTSNGKRYEFVVRNTEGTGINPTKILVDVK